MYVVAMDTMYVFERTRNNKLSSLCIVFLQYPVHNDNSVELPSFVELSAASKDLLKRLLENDPSRRLRALYALKRIAFFKDFSFDDVVSRRVSIRKV